MSHHRIATPSRLHFGLLGWGSDTGRQFGGVGLMIEEPGLQIEARPAENWDVVGDLASKAQVTIGRIRELEPSFRPLNYRILRAPREHVGLGTGTQLALAITRLALESEGEPTTLARLAQLSGRGLRSGIGLNGFTKGGLIVDGGRSRTEPGRFPPLIAHHEFPEDWWILLAIPGGRPGLHGEVEQKAFDQLKPVPQAITAELCRIVLLELLPAVAYTDLQAFGLALESIQQAVGQCFAGAQGGIYAHPDSTTIVRRLREAGLAGVGQSSWGPTLYGFTDRDAEWRHRTLNLLHAEFQASDCSMFWTRASQRGAHVGCNA